MTPISKPRVLIIDDDPQDRSLSSVVLSRRLPQAQIEQIDGAQAFATELRRAAFDLVITEMQLAWSDGFEVVAALQEAKAGVAVVAFTDLRDEEVAVEGMKSGFVDFVFKSSGGYLRLPEAAVEALERAEQQLLVARSEPWLGTLLDRANVGAFRTTLDQRLIESTPAVLRLLGIRNVQEALRVRLPEPFFAAEDTEELRERLGNERALQSREVQLRRPDGKNVWLSLTELLLLDVDNEMVIDSLVQDVSHLKRREDAFRSRVEDLERSNADLSEFAYIASHELQEPLRMVEKFGSILAEEFGRELGTEGGELLGFVVDGARRMQGLVDDLLAIVRDRTSRSATAVSWSNRQWSVWRIDSKRPRPRSRSSPCRRSWRMYRSWSICGTICCRTRSSFGERRPLASGSLLPRPKTSGSSRSRTTESASSPRKQRRSSRSSGGCIPTCRGLVSV